MLCMQQVLPAGQAAMHAALVLAARCNTAELSASECMKGRTPHVQVYCCPRVTCPEAGACASHRNQSGPGESLRTCAQTQTWCIAADSIIADDTGHAQNGATSPCSGLQHVVGAQGNSWLTGCNRVEGLCHGNDALPAASWRRRRRPTAPAAAAPRCARAAAAPASAPSLQAKMEQRQVRNAPEQAP